MKFRLMEGTHVEQTGYQLADGTMVQQLRRDQEGVPITKSWSVRRDKKGNIIHQPVIETRHDLHAKFDQNPDYAPKFVRLPDDYIEPETLVMDETAAVENLSPAEIKAFREYMVQQAARQGFNPATSNTGPTSPPLPVAGATTLDSMSFEDLKKHAEEEEINLKGAKTREDALRIIKSMQKVK